MEFRFITPEVYTHMKKLTEEVLQGINTELGAEPLPVYFNPQIPPAPVIEQNVAYNVFIGKDAGVFGGVAGEEVLLPVAVVLKTAELESYIFSHERQQIELDISVNPKLGNKPLDWFVSTDLRQIGVNCNLPSIILEAHARAGIIGNPYLDDRAISLMKGLELRRY